MPKKTKEPAFEIPKIIIWTGKTIAFFSSYLAVRYALYLFGKPQRHTTPKREVSFYEAAKSNRIFVPTVRKYIQLYQLGSSEKKILLVHGWSGRGTQLYKIAEQLVDEGFEILSFDGPAHGNSSGNHTIFEEFVETVLYLNRTQGKFQAAIGHSFGGMILLNAIHRGMILDKFTIISSGNKVEDVIKSFVKNIHLSAKIERKMIQYLERKTGMKIEQLASSEFIKNSSIPGLIIHDNSDFEVPVFCAHQIKSAVKNGTLLITENLGHRRILRDSKVIDSIVNFKKQS